MAGSVNPDIAHERQRASFDPLDLTHLFYGGPEKLRRKRYLENLAIQDQVYKGPHWQAISREERFSETVRKSIHYVQQVQKLGLTDPMDIAFYRSTAMPNELPSFGLHTGMFIPTLEKQCSEEQKARWLALAKSYQIIGTYAQTEMGHGTFVRGLETTATYDPKTKEFVLNSPTLTSIKFWPGNLGKVCNYAVVLAQCYSQGQCHGLQSFVVPLRRLDDHEPLPGITIGDIGLKMGYDSIDNGFLKLDNIRIPRENMLMGIAQVLEDGTFVKPKNDKLIYGSMVFIRSVITSDVARSLAQVVTIAIRYSAVRRQTEDPDGEGEKQVLDYQTQQYKLFPHLAEAVAFFFVGRALFDLYTRISQQIDQGHLDDLPQLHATSAGMKAFSSWAGATAIEECRMACGGHGYSEAAGIFKIYSNIVPAATYEGENTVMYLQTARYLMKCYRKAKQGQRLPSMMSYLNEDTAKPASITSDLNLASLVAAYYHRAARLVKVAAERMGTLVQAGRKPGEAWNLSSVQLTQASQAHCHAFVVLTFAQVVTQRPMDSKVRRVLTALCQLYAVDGIVRNAGDFLMDGYLSGETVAMLQGRLLDLLVVIRPEAVAMVDSFDFTDRQLDSCLGRYDGNVYQALWQFVQNSRLNEKEVHDIYPLYLKPFMEKMREQGKKPDGVTARL